MKNRNRVQRCFAVLSSVSVTGAGGLAAVVWSIWLEDTGDVYPPALRWSDAARDSGRAARAVPTASAMQTATTARTFDLIFTFSNTAAAGLIRANAAHHLPPPEKQVKRRNDVRMVPNR